MGSVDEEGCGAGTWSLPQLAFWEGAMTWTF
jgi:hypothetical protein